MIQSYRSTGRSHPQLQNCLSLCACLLIIYGSRAADVAAVFTEHPSPTTTYVGMNVALTSRVSSDWPASFQWLANDKPLSGRTNATLNLFCVSLTQSGKIYSVVASNAFGAVTSAPALLQVVAPEFGPSQHVWGVNETVVNERFNAMDFRTQIGRQINVDLQDTSAGGIWGTGIYTDDSSISGAAYHHGLLAKGSKGTVAIRITGPQTKFTGSTQNDIVSGAYNSWPGSFSFIGLVPTILRHPVSQVRMLGGTAVFNVEASGKGVLSYQWKHNGAILPGQTAPSLKLEIKSEAQSGCYAVTVTDDNGSNSSDYAVLGVLPLTIVWPRTPIRDPRDTPIGDIRHMVLTGKTNTGTIWGSGFYTSDSDLELAATHEGWIRHGETKVLTIVSLPEQRLFLAADRNAVLSRRFNTVFGSYAFAGVVPTVLRDPVSQAVQPGGFCRLKVQATHDEPVAFQWRKNGVLLEGATADELVVPAGEPGSVVVYDAVALVPGNPVPTESAYLFTLPPDVNSVRVSTPAEAQGVVAQAKTLVYAPLTGGLSPKKIYGTGIYTSDSDPEAAAFHSDRLAAGQSEEVGLYGLGMWTGFYGSTRNNLTSASYTGMPGYVFLCSPAQPEAPTLSMVSPGTLILKGTMGAVYQIWGSSALGGHWQLLNAITLGSPSQTWQDSAALQQVRFYRAVLAP